MTHVLTVFLIYSFIFFDTATTLLNTLLLCLTMHTTNRPYIPLIVNRTSSVAPVRLPSIDSR
jgi:hypothetical protein